MCQTKAHLKPQNKRITWHASEKNDYIKCILYLNGSKFLKQIPEKYQKKKTHHYPKQTIIWSHTFVLNAGKKDASFKLGSNLKECFWCQKGRRSFKIITLSRHGSKANINTTATDKILMGKTRAWQWYIGRCQSHKGRTEILGSLFILMWSLKAHQFKQKIPNTLTVQWTCFRSFKPFWTMWSVCITFR